MPVALPPAALWTGVATLALVVALGGWPLAVARWPALRPFAVDAAVLAACLAVGTLPFLGAACWSVGWPFAAAACWGVPAGAAVWAWTQRGAQRSAALAVVTELLRRQGDGR